MSFLYLIPVIFIFGFLFYVANKANREYNKENERLRKEREKLIDELLNNYHRQKSNIYNKTITDDVREKLFKMYKLSVRGIQGEKENAQKMLTKQLQEKSITLKTLLKEQNMYGKEKP